MDTVHLLVIEDDEHGTEIVADGDVETTNLNEWAYVNETSSTIGIALREDLDKVVALPAHLRAQAFATIARWVIRRERRMNAIGGRLSDGGADLIAENTAAVTDTMAEWATVADPDDVAAFTDALEAARQ